MRIDVINDGTGTEEIGNYTIRWDMGGGYWESKYEGWPRATGQKDQDGYLRLLYAILKKEYEE